MREIDPKELTHDRLGEQFAEALSDYDTLRRVEVLVDEFFEDDWLRGKTVLDVGCGLGHFSERLQQRGAIVTACDIGSTLVELTRQRVGCECVVADALRLRDHFPADAFDAVVSSECIEHTPSPAVALAEMAHVLKPGGWLAVSTPNLLWYPVVRLATMMRLRPFDGYENFSTWTRLRSVLQENQVQVVREQGLHLFPFQLRLHGLSRWCDRRLQNLRGAMINLCLLGQKQPAD